MSEIWFMIMEYFYATRQHFRSNATASTKSKKRSRKESS